MVSRSHKGKSQEYKHPEKQSCVTMPHHEKDLPIGTAKSILKQAGLK
nr:type II toxin-antitoxin system HicA family toxin [Neisseria iguanae]